MRSRPLLARLLTGLAGFGLIALPVAAPAQQRCVAPENVRDMLVVLTPGIVGQMDKVCTAAGRPSFLADPQIKRFADAARVAGDAALPSAVAGFKGIGQTTPPAGMNDQLIGLMMREMFAPTLINAERFKPESCEPARNLFRSLSGMAPAQAGELVVNLLVLSGAKNPSICRS